jgi:Protein of unknown function (DUF2997)
MTKVVEVIVRPNGRTSLETKGFVGSECQEASRFIKEALGQSTHEHLTSKFYQQLHHQRRLHEGN